MHEKWLTIPAFRVQSGLSDFQVRNLLKHEPHKLPHIRVKVGKRHMTRIDPEGAKRFIEQYKVG